MARVSLAEGESVVAHSGAMVGMSTNVAVEATSAGLRQGIKRVVSGEGFFRTTFTAEGAPGEVLLAPALAGDMVVLDMTEAGYFMQSTSFIASTQDVEVEPRLGGFRSFFASEGAFVLKGVPRESGVAKGQLLVGAFGGIEALQCDGQLVIDTGHLVAWDANLTYSVTRSADGWLQSFMTGEGLACHFRGEGRVYIQTRNPSEYGRLLGRLLPGAS